MIGGIPLVDSALRYTTAGFYILACHPHKKAPLTEHGAADATTDEAAIRDLFGRQFPHAGLGMALPGLVVVDVDVRDGKVIKVESEDFSMVHSVGGTESAWVGETSARPETATPQFRLITPAFGELYANPMLTQRLLDDNAFDLENWLIEELVEAFAAGEGAAFMTGDGVNKPRGLLTYDTASTADGVRGESAMQYVASGASGAFAASNPHDKLMTLVHAVKPRYRRGSSWLMNTNTLEALRTIKNGSGDYIFRAGLELGQPDTLLGYPLFEDENMPDISAGSLSIAFGNFLRGYVVADRNTSLLRDPFSAKPYVGFYTTQRVGACVRDFRAIKFMKFSAS